MIEPCTTSTPFVCSGKQPWDLRATPLVASLLQSAQSGAQGSSHYVSGCCGHRLIARQRNFGFLSIISFSCTILVTWEGVLVYVILERDFYTLLTTLAVSLLQASSMRLPVGYYDSGAVSDQLARLCQYVCRLVGHAHLLGCHPGLSFLPYHRQ